MEQGYNSPNLTLLKQFQSLVNFKFERALRDKYEKSFQVLFSQFHSKLQVLKASAGGATLSEKDFELIFRHALSEEYKDFSREELLFKIVIRVTEDSMVADPSVNDWIQLIKAFDQNILKQIGEIQCLRTREIESARENKLINVFEENDQLLNWKDSNLNYYLDNFKIAGDLYVNKILDFQSVMKLSIENMRKNLKKASFEDFAKELRRLKNKQRDLEKILFKSNIRAGIFYVNVDQVKAICLEKLKEAVSVLYELLISKIGKENQKVEEDVVKFT